MLPGVLATWPRRVPSRSTVQVAPAGFVEIAMLWPVPSMMVAQPDRATREASAPANFLANLIRQLPFDGNIPPFGCESEHFIAAWRTALSRSASRPPLMDASLARWPLFTLLRGDRPMRLVRGPERPL